MRKGERAKASIHAADRKAAKARRAACSANMKALWKDPVYRAAQTAERKARMQAFWDDPEKSAVRRAKLAALNRTDESRERARKRLVERNATPAEKARLSAHLKAMHERPEFKALARAHGTRNANAINAKKHATRNVVPPGKLKLYNKLTDGGLDRAEALRQCWIDHDKG